MLHSIGQPCRSSVATTGRSVWFFFLIVIESGSLFGLLVVLLPSSDEPSLNFRVWGSKLMPLNTFQRALDVLRVPHNHSVEFRCHRPALRLGITIMTRLEGNVCGEQLFTTQKIGHKAHVKRVHCRWPSYARVQCWTRFEVHDRSIEVRHNMTVHWIRRKYNSVCSV